MKPRLLDLFAGIGGCAMGYHRAGFEVVGIDIAEQPHYPFEFHQMDALEAYTLLRAWPDGLGPFAAISASPPCQAYSKAQRLQGNEHPALIAETRRLLQTSGLPYVIENVENARSELVDPVMLCGTMFGLALYRHRLFECSFPVTEPLHGQHYLKQVKMGRRPAADELHQPVGHFPDVERARRDMEMPWATQHGIAEAVPPAYTAYVGAALLEHIEARAAA